MVGLCKCFLTGGNSTLRQHCRKHYELYKKRCKEAGIPVNYHVIPPKIAQVQEKGNREKSQTKLDDMLVNRSEAFTREGTLHSVAQFVACDDQVSRLSYYNGQHWHLQAKLEGFRRFK